VKLKYPKLPCIVLPGKRGNALPMELCEIVPGQRLGKLSASQTAGIIKHAAVRPSQRQQSIQRNVTEAGMSKDVTNKLFGVEVHTHRPSSVWPFGNPQPSLFLVALSELVFGDGDADRARDAADQRPRAATAGGVVRRRAHHHAGRGRVEPGTPRTPRRLKIVSLLRWYRALDECCLREVLLSRMSSTNLPTRFFSSLERITSEWVAG